MVALKNGTPWPIPPWGEAYLEWRENDAWYTGNTERLAWIYSNGRTTPRTTHQVAGQTRTGGVVGAAIALGRTFWGRPVPTGEERRRLHVPAAGDIATLSSDLLFARPPRISYGTDDATTTSQADRLELLMSSDAAHAWMQEGGEYCSAFGATALTLDWDKDTTDHVIVSPAAADVTVPEFLLGKLTALNLWSEYAGDGGIVYRHIERREPGVIIHTLYQGTRDNLGVSVPLQDRPETDVYAALVDEDGGILTGIKEIAAVWWLNQPARLWRKKGVLAEAGRSDYTGGVKGLFDALDETWSSWMRDIDLGRARLVVPRGYLEHRGRGDGATFDTDRAIYSPLDLPGSPAAGVNDSISQVQFAIRVTEHEQTAQALYRRILASAGYGELDKETAQTAPGGRTATEVMQGGESQDRTRDKKALYARQALAHIGRLAMLLDGVQFPGKGGGDLPLPEVVFPPAADSNPQQTATTAGLLRTAGLLSTETGIRMAHPEWSKDEVDEELLRLRTETAVTDPTASGPFGGTDPTGGGDPGDLTGGGDG